MSISTALSRGLSLLAAFAEAPVWLSNSDLTARTGLPAPTVARLAKSLRAMGLLHYSSTHRRFRLGARVLTLGCGVHRETRFIAAMRPLLQSLADRHRVHVSLAVLEGTDALCLEVCHSASTLLTLRLEVGSRIPLLGTATGHAILATLSEAERKGIMPLLKARDRETWPALFAGLERALEEAAETGTIRSLGGWHPDINAVAIPLRSSALGGAMSITCAAPARHLPEETFAAIIDELMPLVASLASGQDISRSSGRPVAEDQ
ncbi:IclR family transcriptional regulator [Nitratireductor sp. ZSWI3]|uniref:IclR family transcriptional regulator n=1 Tax=Nitratireductor sp. ZSWI3 TaxID=2966359 RepID=UPI00214F9E2E|nr:IclR family transcriptional regulator [Nitratireductor sp. ZSWI3]MCR4266211.1 IclR family transcriptional regulator [Nitratireductor sp. ZSWI3]